MSPAHLFDSTASRLPSFHAPSRAKPISKPSKPIAPPTPRLLTRYLTRLAKYFAHRFSSLPLAKCAFVVSVTVSILFVWFIITSLFRRSRSVNHVPLPLTSCCCPPPSTAVNFEHKILTNAGFVAKAVHLNISSAFVVLQLSQVYRGNIHALQRPLVISKANIGLCTSASSQLLGSAAVGHNTEWLVVGSHISNITSDPSAPSFLEHFASFYILHAARYSGFGCAAKPSPGHSTAHGEQQLVWMTPWTGLAADVTTDIQREADDSINWWRHKNAWVEFAGAVTRAAKQSTPSHQKPHLPELSSNGNHDLAATSEWWLEDGVSIIAACMNRADTLKKALPSWLAAENINEIVLVDWSSQPAITDILKSALNDSRILLLRVEDEAEWVLSRAYNLAARAATFSRLLKLDCDTFVHPDFIESHPMTPDIFYAGDWRILQVGVSEKLHANGLLYVHRDDFLAAGGYDERITTYGWDDSDMAERLSKLREAKSIVYQKIKHISHSASLRVINQHRQSLLSHDNPHAAAVEIQRNRLLLTKFNLPAWSASSLHTQWNFGIRKGGTVSNSLGIQNKNGATYLSASASSHVTPASALISDSDAEDAAKRAIRLILHRYGVQLLPKSLSLEFYRGLMAKVAFPHRYAEVVVALRGGCMARLLSHLSSKIAVAAHDSLSIPPPQPYIGWRLQELWQSPDSGCSCKYTDVIQASQEEVISLWVDSSNKIPNSYLANIDRVSADVIPLLKSFDVRSIPKQVSSDLARWQVNASFGTNSTTRSRILIEELACIPDPKSISAERREEIRKNLGGLVPTEKFLAGMQTSLSNRNPSLLDFPEVDKEAWKSIVGDEDADAIGNLFKSSDITAMTSRWSSTPREGTSYSHDLVARASSLAALIRFAEKQKWEHYNSHTVSTRAKEIGNEISRRVDRLFLGCSLSPYEYVQEFPQLAVIIAAWFSVPACT